MQPLVDDGDFKLFLGDALTVLRELPDESVHCCVTSPPYFGLRDYGTPGQLGLEATPGEYVAAIVDVFREVKRVLRNDGTCWINLGDSYNSIRNDNPGGGFRSGDASAQPKGYVKGRGRALIDGLKHKDLVGAPWRVAFALQADGWYLRSDIIWSKPNPMPESVTDRPTKAHEYVFLLSKSARYFFDQEAVREPHTSAERNNLGRGMSAAKEEAWRNGAAAIRDRTRYQGVQGHPAGRNLRSVWEIATQPFPDAHFATFPEALPDRCIRAGTSERGCCPECGAPWVRKATRAVPPREVAPSALDRYGTGKAGVHRKVGGQYQKWLDENPITTTGWTNTCCCLDPTDDKPWVVPCTVLDPFLGSGTTALVARRLGRRSIGIELSEEYARLAAQRLQQLSLLAEPA